MNDTAPATRFYLKPAARRIAAGLVIDTDRHPHDELTTLIDQLWTDGLLTGPARPTIHTTSEYEILAAVTLADGIVIHTGAVDFADLAGTGPDERTALIVLDVLAGITGVLNNALTDHAEFVAARLDELTFLQMAAGFHDEAQVTHLTYQLNPTPVGLRSRALLTLLEAASAPPWYDHYEITPGELVADVAALGDDEPDEDLRHRLSTGAAALGIDTDFLERFETEAETSPAVAIELAGYLVRTAALLGLASTDDLSVTFADDPTIGLTFRVAGTVTHTSSSTHLMSQPMPTSILTGISSPSAAWRALQAVETCIAALNGTIATHALALSTQYATRTTPQTSQEAA